MADSGGHWKDLDEARKLTESTKIPGVFETDVKRVNPAERCPVVQASGTGKSIKWLRELNFTEDGVIDLDIGDQMTWADDIEYTEVETYLKRLGIQRKLDNFVRDIYGTYNNYRARVLIEIEKKVMRRIGRRIVYGDLTYGASGQWDGYHALAAERGAPWTSTNNTNDSRNMDMETGALSLRYLRDMDDGMPYGIDEILAPYSILKWLDAAYEERGFTQLYDTAGTMGFLQRTFNDIGRKILYWNGIPLTRTDYLEAEQDGTGTGSSSNLRAVNTSGTKTYSMFFLKYGNVMEEEPGVCFAFGNTEGQGDLYKFTPFPQLEDYDGEGMRMVTYGAVLLGSYLCLGRIFDITDAEIVV